MIAQLKARAKPMLLVVPRGDTYGYTPTVRSRRAPRQRLLQPLPHLTVTRPSPGRYLAVTQESAETAANQRGILSAVAGVRPLASEHERAALLAAGQRAGLQLDLVPRR